jgi:hypothetical protein
VSQASVPKRRDEWAPAVPIVTATHAMPLCLTRHTALPAALISCPLDTTGPTLEWSGLRPSSSGLRSCPVTHCQLAQPACLLAGEDSSPDSLSFRLPVALLFSLAPLRILPRIIPLRGRCGSPSFPILPPA